MSETAKLLQIIEVQSEISAGDLDLEAAMQLITDRARALIGASATAIALPEAGGLTYRAASGGVQRLGERYPLDASLGGICLAQRQVLYSEDCEIDPRVDRAICRRLGARSLLCAPLIHKTETLGVLSAYHPEPDRFDAGDVRALDLIGTAISAHLHHARRFAQEAHRSRHDSMTGLPNRRAYEERLPIEAARAERQGHPLTLCLLDLDGFKAINDRHGHPAGDEILGAVAAAIRGSRLSDDVFRIGGDEFAILLPDCDREGAESAMARVLEAVDLSSIAVDQASLGISFGVGCEETDPARLHAGADRDLVAAKDLLYTEGERRSRRGIDPQVAPRRRS